VGRLVDQRTGLRVLDLASNPITLDTTTPFSPLPTGNISFDGNLPATITGPLAQVLRSAGGFEQGTAPVMLGSVATNSFSVPVGETWTMEIAVDGAAPQTVNIPGQSSTSSTRSRPAPSRRAMSAAPCSS
jgi:hypothetical protein